MQANPRTTTVLVATVTISPHTRGGNILRKFLIFLSPQTVMVICQSSFKRLKSEICKILFRVLYKGSQERANTVQCQSVLGSRWRRNIRSDRVHSIKYWSVLSGNLSNVLFIQKLLIKSIKPVGLKYLPGTKVIYQVRLRALLTGKH